MSCDVANFVRKCLTCAPECLARNRRQGEFQLDQVSRRFEETRGSCTDSRGDEGGDFEDHHGAMVSTFRSTKRFPERPRN